MVDKVGSRNLDGFHPSQEECYDFVDHQFILIFVEVSAQKDRQKVCLVVVGFRDTCSSFVDYAKDSSAKTFAVANVPPLKGRVAKFD